MVDALRRLLDKCGSRRARKRILGQRRLGLEAAARQGLRRDRQRAREQAQLEARLLAREILEVDDAQ